MRHNSAVINSVISTVRPTDQSIGQRRRSTSREGSTIINQSKISDTRYHRAAVSSIVPAIRYGPVAVRAAAPPYPVQHRAGENYY